MSEMESIAFKVTNPYEAMQSPFNPTPGTGRTGYVDVPPNNFPWVKEESRFVPPIQADGGQLSDIIDIYT